MKNINSAVRLLTAVVFSVGLLVCQTAPPSIQTGPDAELSYDGLHIAETIGRIFRRSNSVTSSSEVRWLIGFGGTRLREGLDEFNQ